MIAQLRIYLYIAAIVALILVGWFVRGWYEHLKDMLSHAAQQVAEDDFKAHESKIAQLVEKRLAELKANERVIEHETTRIIERPVYRNDCVDDDGLQLLRRMAHGADPGKPAGEVPAAPSGSGRKDGR